ncbi:NAD-dependent epimerase/dehydratase family protein [Nostoc sp. C117]|uniref:NAD-dependent epimerase/dehydratase family protein n=1 Tax=Nostoc sp. C117 TaxID=3349875 RepID=UPI00370D0E4F
MTLNFVVTGADTELGQETTRQLVAGGHQVTGIPLSKDGLEVIRLQGGLPVDASLTNASEIKNVLQTANANVVVNLTPQMPNTLLSDGQDWKGFDKTLKATTAALLEAIADSKIQFVVHTSYTFLYGNATNATETTPLVAPGDDPIFTAAIAAENQVLNSKIPSSLLRMGYLYGPQSKDLKLYIKSFQLKRPYFAGPANNLGNWLHFEDAAIALVKAGEQQKVGAVFNVVDGTPVSFADFIDYFAFTLGRKQPAHIPMWLTPLALLLIITPQQVELLKLATTIKNDSIEQQLGWKPRYLTYKEGLQQTVQTWRSKNEI